MKFAEELLALHEKRASFRSFYLRTKTDWRRMAVALHRHWHVPPTVTADDVEQELLLGAWVAVGEWRADLGPSLQTHVVWRSHNRATKWLHKQRGANQHTRKGASSFAYCISAITADADVGARILENHRDGAPLIEETLDYETLLGELTSICETEEGRAALAAFIAADGDLERAAREFHANKTHRYLFRLTPERAKQVIRSEIRSVRRALLCSEETST